MYQESGPIVRALGFGPIFRCQTFHLEHRTNQDDGLTRKSVLLSAQKQVNSLAPEIRNVCSVQNHHKLTHLLTIAGGKILEMQAPLINFELVLFVSIFYFFQMGKCKQGFSAPKNVEATGALLRVAGSLAPSAPHPCSGADLTPPTFAQTTRRTKCLAAKLRIQSYPRTS